MKECHVVNPVSLSLHIFKKEKKKRQFQHDTSKTYCGVYGDTISVRLSLYEIQKMWPAAAPVHESNFHEIESCQWRRGSGNAVWQSTDFNQPDRRRYITAMEEESVQSEGVCVCVFTSDTRWRAAPGPGCSWQTAWAHVRSSWTRPAVDDIDEYCRQTEGVLMKYRTHTLWIIYFITLSFEHQSFCPQLKQNKAKDTFDI